MKGTPVFAALLCVLVCSVYAAPSLTEARKKLLERLARNVRSRQTNRMDATIQELDNMVKAQLVRQIFPSMLTGYSQFLKSLKDEAEVESSIGKMGEKIRKIVAGAVGSNLLNRGVDYGIDRAYDRALQAYNNRGGNNDGGNRGNNNGGNNGGTIGGNNLNHGRRNAKAQMLSFIKRYYVAD